MYFLLNLQYDLITINVTKCGAEEEERCVARCVQIYEP